MRAANLRAGASTVEGRRPKEALRIANALLEEDPLRLADRLIRIDALGQLRRYDDAREEILATEKLFREQKRLNVSSLQSLAVVASKGNTHDIAVRFWRELVERREKALGGVSRADSSMSYYYTELTKNLIYLKHWEEALASSQSAIVAAGKNNRRAKSALSLFDRLLRTGPIDELTSLHDKAVDKSGRDAPIVRKAIGRAWITQRNYTRAIEQLRLATELQANDPESWQLLVQAHDSNGDRIGALQAFQESLVALPFDIKRATEYAQRLDAAGERELAERAWTNLVELRPDEADSHSTLARWLQKKARWKAARDRWLRVVAIRKEEPEGWFALVKAHDKCGEGVKARSTLRLMMGMEWEARFGDVKTKIARHLSRMHD